VIRSLLALSLILGALSIPEAFTSHKPDANKAHLSKLPQSDLELIKVLNARQVDVVFSVCNAPSVAQYNAQRNVVILCTDVEDPDRSDSIRHEAIHAAQDCKAGQGNSSLSILNPEINPFTSNQPADSTVQMISTYYPPTHHALEWEAWTLAARLSSSQVAQLVNRYC
jgi:hypothetical protein